MIKKLVSLIALSLALVNTFATIVPKATTTNLNCPNCMAETIETDEKSESGERHKDKKSNKEHCPINFKNDIKMLSSDNYLKLLSDDEKKDLKEMNTCIEKGEELSKKQIKNLKCYKDKVIKCILGENEFKEFKELMKKDYDKCITKEEKTKLDEYIKKINISK